MKKFVPVLSLLLACAVCLASCGRIIVKTDKDDDEEETKKAKVTASVEDTDDTADNIGAADDTFTEPTVRPYPGSVKTEYTPGRMENGAFVNEWSNIKYIPLSGEVVVPDGEIEGAVCSDMTSTYDYGDEPYGTMLMYFELGDIGYSAFLEGFLEQYYSQGMILDDYFSANVAGHIYQGYEMFDSEETYGVVLLFREFQGYAECIGIYREYEFDIDPIFERFTKYK